MKSLDELTDVKEPAIEIVKESVARSENTVEILPPSVKRGDLLKSLQITTRSTRGAIVYETGGILIENGWIRFLGSGHEKLSRNIIEWNRNRSSEYLLVADDIVGGFFAINGGGLGEDVGSMYYWAPDSLEWEELELGFTDFFEWALTSQVNDFYADLGKDVLKKDFSNTDSSKCISFFPFLWTVEGSVANSEKSLVPIEEAFDLKIELIKQLVR